MNHPKRLPHNLLRNPHFKAIQELYGDQCALRSGVPYLNHIVEGVAILHHIGAHTHTHAQRAIDAYCIHPLVQNDAALMDALDGADHPTADNLCPRPWLIAKHAIPLTSLLVAMEYRRVANSYLPSGSEIHLQQTPVADVRMMLIADKVQNRKDFQRHNATLAHADRLHIYFLTWMAVLGINQFRYEELCGVAAQGLSEYHALMMDRLAVRKRRPKLGRLTPAQRKAMGKRVHELIRVKVRDTRSPRSS